MQDIVNLLLDDVQVTLDKKGITMDVSQDAKDWLIEEGYDEALGARPLRNVLLNSKYVTKLQIII